jgi:hypothetical protein
VSSASCSAYSRPSRALSESSERRRRLTFDVSRERLLLLLGQHAESPTLEFVATCDLSDRHDIVELAAEVGALAARGGSIVIGVDDHGRVQNLFDDTKSGLFDEAALRDKLGRYLPGSVELRVGRHEIDGRPVVLIEVGAHRDGAVVFTADGNYEQNGKQQTAFRKGEFFVRHGTKSELPNQDDIRQLGLMAVERERLWIDQLHRVQEAVYEIGRVAEAEAGGEPHRRVVGFGIVSRLPTARQRLAGCLAALAQTGGPPLSACEELANGSTVLFYGQALGAVFSATEEVTRALRQQS